MTAVVISTTTLTLSGADPAAQNITVPTDCTAVYVFWTFWANGTFALSSITLDGQAPNQSVSGSTSAGGLTARGCAAFYNPATGTRALDLAFGTAPAEGPLCVVVFVKDGDTTAWRDADTASGLGETALSLTLDTQPGDLVLKFDEKYGTTTPSLTSGWSNVATQTIGDTESGRLSAISAADTSQVVTAEDEYYSALVAISIPASAGQTYTHTASGGISFAGAALPERQKIQLPAGGLSFAGSSLAARARAISATGEVIFAGAADYSTQTGGTSTREVVSSGGIAFSGTPDILRQRLLSALGGISFSGASNRLRQAQVSGSGGLSFAGASGISRQSIRIVFGGIQFSGTAPYTTHESTRMVVPAGGIVFGGAAQASFPSLAALNFVAGTAVASDGMMSTIYLADGVAVPGGASFIGGIAHSAEGYRYICPWPSAALVGYSGGRAIREDGAQVVSVSFTAEGAYSGFTLSYRGELLISLSTEGKFKDGLGIRSTGALPVSDNT